MDGISVTERERGCRPAFKGVHKGIYMQTSHRTNVFIVRHIKVKAHTTRYLVREMLPADDSAIVIHIVVDMQMLLDQFARAAIHLSLELDTKGDYTCTSQSYSGLLHINKKSQEPLVQANDFTYSGTTASKTITIEKEM